MGKRCSGIVIGLGLLLAAVAFGGCSMSPPPDPNDPHTVAPQNLAPLLHKTLKEAADALNDRVLKRQMTDQERLDKLAQESSQLLTYGDAKNCRPQDAWIYGDLLMTARHYDEAVPVLQKAVKYAESVKDDDRRVNDSLRLADALAELGKTEQSLNLVQKIVDSNPKDPGPVLPAVLLQITPVTQGKGHDPQLAKVLEESIHEHLKEKVDPNSDAGKMFLFARIHHIRKAWFTIVQLLGDSGHQAEAAAAAQRGNKMLQQLEGTPVSA